MRKLFTTLCMMTLVSWGIIAQEIDITGEVKTGFYWEDKLRDGQSSSEKTPQTSKMHNNDDAGSGLGRFRLNVDLTKGNLGFMFRIEQTGMNEPAPDWPYAFGYINLYDDQFKFSVGKLGGGSPWSTGGPEMWKELETVMGVRFEYKPSFVPGLNVGAVLNGFDKYAEQQAEATLTDYLNETVFGVRYDHEYFGVRFEYRLDSDIDTLRPLDEGASLIYRVEERILTKYLPGFQIWANGNYTGISAEEEAINFVNWLYIQYAPENLTAQLRVGYDVISNRSILHLRPSFYYNFFSNLLNVGTSFQFAQDFGEGKVVEDSPFSYWNVEPKVQVNFGSAYTAFVFHYGMEYKYRDDPSHPKWGPQEQMKWLNIRFGYTF
ncbi:hypothetical protein AGMMS50267_04140 [Spirochaetia bacterium]|nr:hypothetical protein AGMMS50267_04140 [Spirochaetia bacterium]